MGKLTSGFWLGLLYLIHVSPYQHRAVWKGNQGPSFVQATEFTEFKCSKVRLEMMLSESGDPCVAQTAPVFPSGRKWIPSTAIQLEKSALEHQDIVGYV